tara:strand:+ start:286 stop:969 length:684 start_codon:yes stop_codon:yes gene_type:complete
MQDDFLNFFKAAIKVRQDDSLLNKDHLLFLRIPKNASSSIMQVLGTRNIVKRYESELTEKLDHNIYKKVFDVTHARPEELRSVINPLELDCFSFAVVRNPWDRVVSMYHFGKKLGLAYLFGLKNDLSFSGFCKVLKDREGDPFFLPVFKQTEWTNTSLGLNCILKFENLREDYKSMVEKNNISCVSSDLPHTNKSKHSHYKDYFTIEDKKLIKSIFEEDCDTFRYSF